MTYDQAQEIIQTLGRLETITVAGIVAIAAGVIFGIAYMARHFR